MKKVYWILALSILLLAGCTEKMESDAEKTPSSNIINGENKDTLGDSILTNEENEEIKQNLSDIEELEKEVNETLDEFDEIEKNLQELDSLTKELEKQSDLDQDLAELEKLLNE